MMQNQTFQIMFETAEGRIQQARLNLVSTQFTARAGRAAALAACRELIDEGSTILALHTFEEAAVEIEVNTAEVIKVPTPPRRTQQRMRARY